MGVINEWRITNNVKIAVSLLQILLVVSAKYYLNWFTVGKVIAKIKRANFLSRHSVVVNIIIMPAIIVSCNVRNGKYVHCADTV